VKSELPPIYPKSSTALLDSRVVVTAWILLVCIGVGAPIAQWAGFDIVSPGVVLLMVFLLSVIAHVVLSLSHRCPACGKPPTVQQFRPPHPNSHGQSRLSGWSGAVMNVIRRRRLVCIHCGAEYRIEA
jgi:hypothetical protein